ncbi:hypothetical protein [Luteolibacter yonseiensis]
MINWDTSTPPKPLDEIFALENGIDLEAGLGSYLFFKRYKHRIELTDAESVFETLQRIGTVIAADGFTSVFCQFLSPDSFKALCSALTEMEAPRLRDLLREAWSIYTKGKDPITLDELQTISVRRFNTSKEMDRFDRIGEEVEDELRRQYRSGTVLSAVYAKKHRDRFIPFPQT